MHHPVVGGLYWVDTLLLGPNDPKPRRPVVVLPIVPPDATLIHVVTRTSNLQERGVLHPLPAGVDLTKDGVFGFAHHRTIDVVHFSDPKRVSFIAMLETQYMEEILKWWYR